MSVWLQSSTKQNSEFWRGASNLVQLREMTHPEHGAYHFNNIDSYFCNKYFFL